MISHMSTFISNILYGMMYFTWFLLLAKHGRRTPLPSAAIICFTSSMRRILNASECQKLHGSLSSSTCRSKASMNKWLCFDSIGIYYACNFIMWHDLEHFYFVEGGFQSLNCDLSLSCNRHSTNSHWRNLDIRGKHLPCYRSWHSRCPYRTLMDRSDF